ncbi:MCE family protein [Gordonia aichiensis]|uniref:Mce family protein n=1 Tax=Gordonia aichiensis NBRC 108223 TaxID=1220583 RepID=L7KH01_9ACTN|nr:MlaD family protein [Gordonia aichiensis]GAC47899.1 Mce family protein [Gordonia aichiensis NBRC 108223]
MKKGMFVIAVIVVVAALVWAGIVHGAREDGPNIVTARFTSATGIYPGDQVTVLGVPVGNVESLHPAAGFVEVRMSVDDSVRIPRDARAALVSQSLVAGRTIQLTPAYTSGPTLGSGTIPLQRTVVPMEWDDIKNSLRDITTEVSSKGPTDPGSAKKLVDAAADDLAPHADDVNNTITKLSQAMTVVADGRDDLFAVVRNLQVFVSAMSGSNDQVAVLHQRLATISQVLGSSRTDVAGALRSLDATMDDVTTFISQNRDAVSSDLRQAADLTSVIQSQKAAVEGILHQAPTQLANFYNIYKPSVGGMTGVFTAANFENPVQAVCGGFASIGTQNSQRGADLCTQYLGAYLTTLKTSYPNFLTSPTSAGFADPGQQIASEPGVLTSVPGLTGPPPQTRSVPRSLSALLLPGGGAR